MASPQQLDYPQPVVLEGSTTPSACVIYLHGLGDSANGWVDEKSGKAWAGTGPRLSKEHPHARFIYPTAPKRPCTLKNSEVLTGWFDIYSVEGINTNMDAAGLKESQRYIEELVQKQVASGIPSERILIGGFSQGGAISLLMLRSNMKLAGVIGMSTFFPLWQEQIVSPANKDTPILVQHGDKDEGVLPKFGQQSYDLLKGLGTKVDYKNYEGMGHSTCEEEIKDMSSFISRCLPPQ